MTIIEINGKIKKCARFIEKALKENNIINFYYWSNEIKYLFKKRRKKIKDIKKKKDNLKKNIYIINKGNKS
jgi:hypothetical protein